MGFGLKILFIHQNFPGQFKFLAPALVQQGHDVRALVVERKDLPLQWQGVQVHPYTIGRGSTPNVHPWMVDMETKTIRAEACFRGALGMKAGGFEPDVIIAHPGWGESLFLKNVWPKAKLGIYCEFYYHNHGADSGFDPEFPRDEESDACRLVLKNTNNLLHFQTADLGISPTQWQASTFPEPFRSKISVIHDGIDTVTLQPNSNVALTLSNGEVLKAGESEVITFVNRNLEPYRGYHTFMRALPALLKARPNARVLMVGGHGVSYGAKPDVNKYGERSWRDIYASEVRGRISDADWGRVHFLGSLPYNQFIPVLQLSTVHVYLTYPFVLSWSMLESMSLGCCIVASDTSPVREAIEHGKTGMLVDFFDAHALSAQIADLMDKPELRQTLSVNARKFACENYDLLKVCLPRQLNWVQQLADA